MESKQEECELVHSRVRRCSKNASFAANTCGVITTAAAFSGEATLEAIKSQVAFLNALTELLDRRTIFHLRSVHPLQSSWYPSSMMSQRVCRIGIRSDEFT